LASKRHLTNFGCSLIEKIFVKTYHSKFSSVCFGLGVTLLAFSILITGCHSYYTIPREDYVKIKTMEDVKVVYTNGKEFVVENTDTTSLKVVGDSLEVYRGFEETVIPMSEIVKIKENRFDLGGTIIIVMIPLIILVALFFASINPGG